MFSSGSFVRRALSLIAVSLVFSAATAPAATPDTCSHASGGHILPFRGGAQFDSYAQDDFVLSRSPDVEIQGRKKFFAWPSIARGQPAYMQRVAVAERATGCTFQIDASSNGVPTRLSSENACKGATVTTRVPPGYAFATTLTLSRGTRVEVYGRDAQPAPPVNPFQFLDVYITVPDSTVSTGGLCRSELLVVKPGESILDLAPQTSASVASKPGNNGTVSCDTYCAGSNWPGVVGGCAWATRLDTNAPVSCDAVVGLTPAGVGCSCYQPFVKHGDNGSVSCETYCTSKSWPGGTGHCISATRTDGASSGTRVACSAAIGVVSSELACTCTEASWFEKSGNNGTVSCDTYCGGSQWGRTGRCAGGYRTDTGENLTCAAVIGLGSPNAVVCRCR